MNEATIKEITAELRDKLVGRKFGKIFVLDKDKLAIDFRREDGAYLFISASPSEHRLYLIKRRVKELNSASLAPGPFANLLRKHLTHAVLTEIEKVEGERIVRMRFTTEPEIGVEESFEIVVQLTGRSSNLFLVDSPGNIRSMLRESKGWAIGEPYQIPIKPEKTDQWQEPPFDKGNFETLSEALDSYFEEKSRKDSRDTLVRNAKNAVKSRIRKKRNLKKKLGGDLEKHGDPEKWKRLGDLLNANIATAKRQGDKVELTDYFDDELKTITIELDENLSLPEAAEAYFKKYAKSKNARIEIANRLSAIDLEIKKEEELREELEEAIIEEDWDSIRRFLPEKKIRPPVKGLNKKNKVSKYARDYVSSDGLLILVGKRSKDNDYLTFRIARSLDIWLHAADYPGSHVVIKRKGREEVPQRTILEAARLAAFFSKAKSESKAAVRYAERKYVNKPKGAAPGLVSLASFKTILVEPGVPDFESG